MSRQHERDRRDPEENPDESQIANPDPESEPEQTETAVIREPGAPAPEQVVEQSESEQDPFANLPYTIVHWRGGLLNYLCKRCSFAVVHRDPEEGRKLLYLHLRHKHEPQPMPPTNTGLVDTAGRPI